MSEPTNPTTENQSQPSLPSMSDIAMLRGLMAGVPLLLIESTHAEFLRNRFINRPVSRSDDKQFKGPEAVTRFDNAKQTGGYGYAVDSNGVATVAIKGAITPESWAWYDNMETISDWIIRDCAAMANDPTVKRVMFINDSPGGYVAGSFEMADAISALASKKPTVTAAGSHCCSASYLNAVQTGHITAYRTSIVGSIGTRSAVIDASKLFEAFGVKMIPIDSGGMKSAGLIGTEITQEQIDYFKSTVMGLQKQFTGEVAAKRGVSMEQATQWADGRVHVADAAKTMGLIDAVGTVTDAYATLLKMKSPPQSSTNPKQEAGESGDKPKQAEAVAQDVPAGNGAEASSLAGDKSPGKGAHMSTPTNPAPANVAPESKPATITELKIEFADDPGFGMECAEKALTMTEAKAAYSDKLRAENKRLKDQQQAPAPVAAPVKAPGAKPVASAAAEQAGKNTGGARASTGEDSAVAEFEQRVADRMQSRNEPRHIASGKVLADDADLRERFNAEKIEASKERIADRRAAAIAGGN